MTAAVAAGTALLAVATLLPLWRNEAWWVRVWDFPRLQLASLAALLALATPVLLDFPSPLSAGLLAAQLGCLAYQAWWIVPYSRLHRPEVRDAAADADGGRRLRLLAANVLTPNRNAAPLLAMIERHDPDLVLTVESDRWWQERLDAIEPGYPFTLKCPLDNLYGMHLYSRLPLEDARIQFLVEEDVPSMHALVVLPGGARVRLHCLHPAPPSPTENAESTERDAELVAVGRSAAEAEHPVVVAGDLNDVAWSATTRLFRKVSGLRDPRVGRGMFNTFHARWPFLRWPLDHLFHSEHFDLVGIRRLPAFGSDHFPFLAELQLARAHASEPPALEADAEDREWAEEKARAEGVDEGEVHAPGE